MHIVSAFGSLLGAQFCFSLAWNVYSLYFLLLFFLQLLAWHVRPLGFTLTDALFSSPSLGPTFREAGSTYILILLKFLFHFPIFLSFKCINHFYSFWSYFIIIIYAHTYFENFVIVAVLISFDTLHCLWCICLFSSVCSVTSPFSIWTSPTASRSQVVCSHVSGGYLCALEQDSISGQVGGELAVLIRGLLMTFYKDFVCFPLWGHTVMGKKFLIFYQYNMVGRSPDHWVHFSWFRKRPTFLKTISICWIIVIMPWFDWLRMLLSAAEMSWKVYVTMKRSSRHQTVQSRSPCVAASLLARILNFEFPRKEGSSRQTSS